jgi:hypothetical protein
VTTGLFISHSPLYHTTDESNPYTVTATVTSTEGSISGVVLYYRTGGTYVSVPMTDQGGGVYEADIPAQPQPTDVEYYLYANDTAANTETSPVTAPEIGYRFSVGSVVEFFEGGAAGWAVGAPNDATTGNWVRVDPNGTAAQPEDDATPDPLGVYAWVTGQGTPGGSLGEADVDGGTTTLYSATYDLSGAQAAEVSYRRWYSNNTGSMPGQDYWVVQATDDAGGSWTDIENTNASLADWTEVVADLETLFGAVPSAVQVRFQASDLLDGSLVEAGVDDFVLQADFGGGLTAVGPAPAGTPERFALSGAHPNPFNPSTVVSYEIPARSDVRLSIFNLRGELVRTLVSTVQEAGKYAILWDGADATGRGVSSGTYFVRMTAGAFSQTQKLTLLR